MKNFKIFAIISAFFTSYIVGVSQTVNLKKEEDMRNAIPQEIIENKIYLFRGQKVILSAHLAKLYRVRVRVLIQAVKRNIDRFPEDFMFQLADEEYKILKSQIVISSWGGVRRANPYAFTEQGVAMLSGILHRISPLTWQF